MRAKLTYDNAIRLLPFASLSASAHARRHYGKDMLFINN
jgi:hypothetical protein